MHRLHVVVGCVVLSGFCLDSAGAKTTAKAKAGKPASAATKTAAAAPNDGGPNDSVPNDSGQAARFLIHSALEAELAGDHEGRQLYLREALEQDAENEQARWNTGQVKVNNHWVSIDEACDAGARARRLAEYKERRAQTSSAPQDQVDLALWCQQNGLVNEARAHLATALEANPALTQTGEALGLVNYQGVLMTAEQVRKEKQIEKQGAVALKQWRPKLIKLAKQLDSKDLKDRVEAESQLRALRDPALVPAIEGVLMQTNAAHALLGVAIIEQIPGQRAATSLVQQAVFSRSPEIRQAAIGALKSRSMFTYAPLLLSALQSPVGARWDDISQDGTPTYRLSLFREGPLADQLATQDLQFMSAFESRAGENFDPAKMQSAQLEQRLQRQQMVATQVNRVANQVSMTNARIREWNKTIGETLTGAAGAPESERPRDYWEWWYDHNDIYYPPERPVQQVEYTPVTVSQYSIVSTAPPPPPLPRVSECFAAGTLVWTNTGKVAIDKLQVGDLVLSQDVDTGELNFKPVVSTSVRPPSELVKLRLDGEEFILTRGHPLFVVGQGWRMVKEINDGELVRTATGSVAVESVEPGVTQQAYNVVVAEWNNYFVGDTRLLAYDNSLRRHTDAVLPGFFVTASK